jgi:hypothetical protein
MKNFGCGIKLHLGVLLLVVTIAAVYSESHSANHAATKAHESVRGEISAPVKSETTNQEPKTKMSNNDSQLVQPAMTRPKTESEKLWYRDPNAIAAIGSIGAVIMSVFALFVSRQGQVAQQLREKHEELRGVLEKLISLREEFTQINRLKYDTEKSWASSYMNAKRAVYLEAAEALAREIPKQVSASEYHVIGIENYFDSDFVQARMYYQLAVQYSRSSSAYKQSEILRALGATYFLQDPAMLDVQEGREYFKKSINVLEKRTDYYSSYTRALCYRDFAYSELSCRNYDDAIPLLNESYNEWLRIPESAGFLRGPDLITIANYWRTLGEGCFREIQSNSDRNIEKGRMAFKKGLEILQMLKGIYGISDDYTIDAQALIYQEWGRQEINAGFKEQGAQLLDKAKEYFTALSDSYMWRATRQLGIDSLLLQATHQDMEKQTVIGQMQELSTLGLE